MAYVVRLELIITCLDVRATSPALVQPEVAFRLDVVIRQGTYISQVIACEDQALLISGNALFVCLGADTLAALSDPLV